MQLGQLRVHIELVRVLLKVKLRKYYWGKININDDFILKYATREKRQSRHQMLATMAIPTSTLSSASNVMRGNLPLFLT